MDGHNLDSVLPRMLPLVGRGELVEALHRLFGDAGPPMLALTGESGVGKSRLVRDLAREAERRDWSVAYGQANPVEVGVPYALFADALLPILKQLDEAALTVLSRGATQELLRLFPALSSDPDGPRRPQELRGDAQEPEELKMRLYWNFTEFLKRLAERTPLMLVLEDLHWADASSLALLHFVARHASGTRIRLAATVNTDYRDRNAVLIETERSLMGIGAMRPIPVQPLSRDHSAELVRAIFKTAGAPVDAFSELLYGWTRGNPYFIEETLKSLIEDGSLYERDGTWLGWEAQALALPGSVREAIQTRLQDLSDDVRLLAETLAVAGGRADAGLLQAVTQLSNAAFLDALEPLVDRGIVEERHTDRTVTLEFHHPLMRETIYADLSILRRRARHAEVADGLERWHGAEWEPHADELAYHVVEAGASPADGRAVRYLAAAGESALRRHADREAAAYLESAVQALEATSGGDEPDSDAPGLNLPVLQEALARARSRLGQYDGAMELWSTLLQNAQASGRLQESARAHRYLGILSFLRGRALQAMEHYDAALAALGDQDSAIAAHIQLNAGVALQALGRPQEARRRIEIALEVAEHLDNARLLGRAHWALALLFTWIGHGAEARRHAWQAIDIADRAGVAYVRFWGRLSLAALEGLVGNMKDMKEMMSQARAVAEELHFPALQLRVAELSVEYHWSSGEWDVALAVGERAISLGRSLNQRDVLPRILVWTALIYYGRGDNERGHALVDEACGMVDTESDQALPDIHRVIPAYIGRMHSFMVEERYEEVVELGLDAVRMVDRSGYVTWLLHRLLPLVAEAYVRLGRIDEAAEIGARLRAEADPMGHRLGLAWADTCDALVTLHQGDLEGCIERFRTAATSLEAIPVVPEAARLRRQLAGRLADLGDREGSLAELRKVHEVFGQLGAQPELAKARKQFQEVGSRAPSRIEAEGIATLTPRETQIARLVADHKSDKGIAKVLSISPRTVTTHLGNVYRKLGIGSRVELGELVREGRLPRE